MVISKNDNGNTFERDISTSNIRDLNYCRRMKELPISSRLGRNTFRQINDIEPDKYSARHWVIPNEAFQHRTRLGKSESVSSVVVLQKFSDDSGSGRNQRRRSFCEETKNNKKE